MDTIQILLTGDFCPSLDNECFAVEKGPELVFNDLLPELLGSDLNIIDLECPLVTGGSRIFKTGPYTKASPQTISLLKQSNIHLVALANNHIMDYGEDGLKQTLKLCHENGIRTVGAGINLLEARMPCSLTIKGRKVKILNFAENEWSTTRGINPGANPLDPIRNYKDICKARKEADIVLIIFHGGNEFYELPSPRLKELFHFFSDAGASAIIAHHTHVSSGYEIYNGVPIFYGLGNFYYSTEKPDQEDWYYGYVVLLRIDHDVRFEIVPIVQNKELPGVHKLNGSDKGYFLGRLDQLNKIIADDECLMGHFTNYSRENSFRYDLLLEPYKNDLLSFLRKRGCFPSFYSRRKKRILLNVIRCEAHRDVLLAYLEKYV